VSANRLESYPGVATVSVELVSSADVQMEVLNRWGKRLWGMQLLHEHPGQHTILFEGRDRRGRPLRKGTYFYRVSVEGATVTRKVTISKEPIIEKLLRLARPMRRAIHL
jgi:hypothetical protein